jgi:hypothetical protein
MSGTAHRSWGSSTEDEKRPEFRRRFIYSGYSDIAEYFIQVSNTTSRQKAMQ